MTREEFLMVLNDHLGERVCVTIYTGSITVLVMQGTLIHYPPAEQLADTAKTLAEFEQVDLELITDQLAGDEFEQDHGVYHIGTGKHMLDLSDLDWGVFEDHAQDVIIVQVDGHTHIEIAFTDATLRRIRNQAAD